MFDCKLRPALTDACAAFVDQPVVFVHPRLARVYRVLCNIICYAGLLFELQALVQGSSQLVSQRGDDFVGVRHSAIVRGGFLHLLPVHGDDLTPDECEQQEQHAANERQQNGDRHALLQLRFLRRRGVPRCKCVARFPSPRQRIDDIFTSGRQSLPN